jgi:hypothetical protein
VRRAVLLVAVLPVAFACSSGDDGGGDTAAFCTTLTGFESDGGFRDLRPTDPGDLDTVLDDLHELEDQAPDEIAAEVEVLTDAAEQFAAAVQTGGGDLSDLLEQVDDVQNARELSTAADRLASYANEQCDLGGGS